MTKARIIVVDTEPADPRHPGKPEDYRFVVTSTGYPNAPGVGAEIIEILGRTAGFLGINSAANEAASVLFRDLSNEFGPDEVFFDDYWMGADYTYELKCEDEVWYLAAVYAGEENPKNLITKVTPYATAEMVEWVKENTGPKF